MSIVTRELEPADWPVLETLFGPRGACGGCWCMVWRSEARGKEYRAQLGESNRRAFRKLVGSGKVFGALAFDGDEVVGWCSTGPRSTFPYLVRTRALNTDWNATTWSITCIFIKRGFRGQGVGTRLVDEAVNVAARHGATAVEAYPATPYDTEKPMPAAFAWTGVPALYERLRFVRLEKEGRLVLRKVI